MKKIFFVRAGEEGKYYNAFIRNNFIAFATVIKEKLIPGTGKKEIRQIMNYWNSRVHEIGEKPRKNIGNGVRYYNFILNEMNIGDIAVTGSKNGKIFSIGFVTGDYYYTDNDSDVNYRHRRNVEWHKEISREELTADIKAGGFYTEDVIKKLNLRQNIFIIENPVLCKLIKNYLRN